MRRPAIALLLLSSPAFAQTVVAPGQLARVRRNFEPRPGDSPLRCEVTPIAPAPNFAFRFQAGYIFHVPQSQYSGSTRGWSVFTAITPEGAPGETAYLEARYALSDAASVALNFDIQGVYFLGVGRYSVESVVRDDRNRICRKQWQIAVQPSRADRAVPSALPPNAVRQFSPVDLPDTHHPDRAAPMRLSVLLNAAAFSERRTVIRPSDRAVLIGALTALLEHLPATVVRVVVFSLEQQREIFRGDGFAPPDVSQVADAIVALEQATVDIHVLQRPLGHVDFLTALIAHEVDAPVPADTVVFLGPMSRYGNKISKDTIPPPAEGRPRFFYVRYDGPPRRAVPTAIEVVPTPTPDTSTGNRTGDTASASGGGSSSSSSSGSPPPPRPSSPPGGGTGGGGPMGGGGGTGGGGGRGGRGARNGPPPMLPPAERLSDIITEAMARLKGRTLAVHSPAELAKAIRKIEGQR